MSITSIRISNEVAASLGSLARKLDRSKNYLINQAIKEFLARQLMEECRWQDTLEALESVKKGKMFDESEVSRWLNSWGSDQELSPPVE